MDPVSVTLLISAIASVLGTAADTIISDIKEKQNMSLSDAKGKIDTALSKAASKGNDKLQSLISRIESIDIIKKSPLLTEVLDRYKNRLIREKNNLRDELNDISAKSLALDAKYDDARNANIFNRDETQNKFNEGVKEIEKDIQKVETRL